MSLENSTPSPREVADKHAALISEYTTATTTYDRELSRQPEVEYVSEIDRENLDRLEAITQLSDALDKCSHLDEDKKAEAVQQALESADSYAAYCAYSEVYPNLVERYLHDHPNVSATFERPYYAHEDYSNRIVTALPIHIDEERLADTGKTTWLDEEGNAVNSRSMAEELSSLSRMPAHKAKFFADYIMQTEPDTTEFDAIISANKEIYDRMYPDPKEKSETPFTHETVTQIMSVLPEIQRGLSKDKEVFEKLVEKIVEKRTKKTTASKDKILESQYAQEDALLSINHLAERYPNQLRIAALAEAALDGVIIKTDDSVKTNHTS